jgi:hypothetical protein
MINVSCYCDPILLLTMHAQRVPGKVVRAERAPSPIVAAAFARSTPRIELRLRDALMPRALRST